MFCNKPKSVNRNLPGKKNRKRKKKHKHHQVNTKLRNTIRNCLNIGHAMSSSIQNNTDTTTWRLKHEAAYWKSRAVALQYENKILHGMIREHYFKIPSENNLDFMESNEEVIEDDEKNEDFDYNDYGNAGEEHNTNVGDEENEDLIYNEYGKAGEDYNINNVGDEDEDLGYNEYEKADEEYNTNNVGDEENEDLGYNEYGKASEEHNINVGDEENEDLDYNQYGNAGEEDNTNVGDEEDEDLDYTKYANVHDEYNEYAGEEENDDFEVSEEYIEFLMENAKFKESARKEKARLKAKLEAEKLELLKQEEAMESSEVKQANLKEVYGDGWEKIMALETSVLCNFIHESDKMQPEYWPNIPFNL